MGVKILFVSNIASPYQVEWAKDVKRFYDCEFWFFTKMSMSETNRPDYWNVALPTYCKYQPARLQNGEFCFSPGLGKKLDKLDPDVVVLGGSWHLIASYQVYRWAVKRKKKIMTMPLEFSENMGKIHNILRNKIIWKFFYGKINLYCANGYLHYDYLKSYLGINNVRIFTNFDNYRPYLTHPERKPIKPITFLYAGSIQPRLRVLELIDIFREAFQKWNKEETPRLVIAGYGPDKDDSIRKVECDKWLKDFVQFYDVDNWNEIPDVYASADVLLNFGKFSPGGGVIFSAVASGMPVVSTSNIHAIRLVVVDQFNGYHTYSNQQFIAAMQRYCRDHVLLLTHSRNAKQIGKAFLNNENHVEQFAEMIDELVL